MDRPPRSRSESRERAISSEPCSTRPNPFDDDDGSSARKRRRTSQNGASPSRSVESCQNSPHAHAQDSRTDKTADMATDDPVSSPPPTPERHQVETQAAAETRPHKITLNLKNRKHTPDSEPSSPISQNGIDIGIGDAPENGIRASVEDSDLDVSHASPDLAETVLSSLDIDNPPIEIIDSDGSDDDVAGHVTLLQDTNPMVSFPYHPNEPLIDSLPKLCQLLPNSHQALGVLHTWIEEYLTWVSIRDSITQHELYVDYKDFWQMLPHCVWQYSSPNRTALVRNPQHHHLLYDFHTAFARLTAAFVNLDLAMLHELSKVGLEEKFEPTSLPFVTSFQSILQDYGLALAPSVVIADCDTTWPEFLIRIVEGFRSYRSFDFSQQSPAQSLYLLGFSVSALEVRSPRLMEFLGGISQLAGFLAREELDRQLSPADQVKSVLAQGYGLYEAVSGLFAACIEKSVNQITPLAANDVIGGLTFLLRICLFAGSEQTQELINVHHQRHPDILISDTAKVIVSEWRLSMLTKLIMSSQMQLRINAAQMMCQDLVRIWKESHDQPFDLGQQPVLRHFSNELLRSGVVSYVLGPTCHPEVTGQSSNIVGFLFASQTFTEELMDLMWRTVTTCQISGVSESLLAMVAQIANLFHKDDLLSVFGKLQTVPIESFTPPMKELCDKVVSLFIEKNDSIYDLLPYSLMFRLLKESSAPGPQSYKTLQKWASNLIVQLLRRGPSHEDRQSLQQDCLKDIAQKTRYTLGSIHALLLLCRPASRERDLQQLTTSYDLPRLLVEELEHAINTREDAGILHAICGPENAPRLDLLTSVIFHARNRESIPQDLGQKLWELLVGEHAASQEDRDCAWRSLSAAMQSVSENPFLEACFKDYFPTLPPELFRPGSLEFITQKILPMMDRENSFILEDEESDEHLAIEQLWRIALTAPSGTIEQQAIAVLVKDVYMENRSIHLMPLHRARKIHLALVSRCMRQLSSAAKYLIGDLEGVYETGPDATPTAVDDQHRLEQEATFTRSLCIVREFHQLHQRTPHFSSPDMRSLVLPENKDVEGDSAELKYQSFDGDHQTDVRPLAIGRRNTAGSLLASLRDATGFDNYRMYYKGQPFTPSERDICKSLEDLQIHNGLILVKREADEDDCPVHVRAGASPVEIEIMRHFDELWKYLALDEKLASEIYSFLITLPVDDQILDLLRKDTTTYRDIFSIGHPLKSLYALYAIREYLNSLCSTESADGGDTDSFALSRVLRLLVSAIPDRDVIDNGSGADLKAALATRLVDQFQMVLRDPMRPASTVNLLDDTLLDRLFEILGSALVGAQTAATPNLVTVTFRAIMDICTLRKDLWNRLCSEMKLGEIVQRLLVDDNRAVVRKSVATTIGEKVTYTQRSSTVSPVAFRSFFWNLIMELVPRALKQPTNSLETFNLAIMICKESDSPELDLHETAQRLCMFLCEYNPSEIPGMALAPPQDLTEEMSATQSPQPGMMDLGAHGLISLLYSIITEKLHEGVANRLPRNLGIELFRRRLFPTFLDKEELLWGGGLIYNEATRARLNDIVLMLVGRDLDQLKIFLEHLYSLVPCTADDQDDDADTPYLYELPFGGFDRSKDIRAACGYAGLRNLSNTCYLNSLCTQLFMNVDFRQFMLSVEVDRRDQSRMLLKETQSMFAHLQSSYRRFVDPDRFVASIKTYDDDMINIHNQMDVEEFFNLLNDRWEGQLRTQEAVRRFRSFYNGQLVTQTKSKECDHVSEVMEPFSAIQCDIKGKKNLLESLEAYVEGEHMEGDNKYKCSSCDRHVDAVRRSCLKETPDSLIFHLKRFDFNLRTQSRSKINDYFAFPDRLDMRPYTIEHLSNSPGGSSEDWFELVGILVHAGTAESGHYYSFIRERPTSREDECWFEFNDDIVLPWDPSKKDACCFGGVESTWDAGGVTFDKNYCAYMLFYERSSALERKQRELQRFAAASPVQTKVAAPLASRIRTDNSRILQRHCLFDPDHIRLLDDGINQLLDMNNGECSSEHDIETVAVRAAIAHLDQVVSRAKDIPDLQKVTDRLRELIDNCTCCAFDVYEYFSTHRIAFENLVLRNPEALVRQSVADLLSAALCSMKAGIIPEGTSRDDIARGVCVMFEPIWEWFHMFRLHRSWPEVFEMMAKFVDSGRDELVAFLGQQYLPKILLIFLAPMLDDDRRDAQFTTMCNILARRPNRPPPYSFVIELLRSILTQITMADPVQNCMQREAAYREDHLAPIRLTTAEHELLSTNLEGGGNALLDKVISINQSVEATDAIVARILEDKWPLEEDLLGTLIVNTVPADGIAVVYGPYLRVATVFCRLSYKPLNIDRLISHIAEYSKFLAASEPKAVWGFFNEAMNGSREHSGESKNTIEVQSLTYLPFWAPPLLAHYDPSLSQQVETVLNEKIFQYGTNPELTEEMGGEGRAKAMVACAMHVGRETCQYVKEAFINRTNAVPIATVVLLQRVLTQCGKYSHTNEDTPDVDALRYSRVAQEILDNLRRLSVDDVEDDGSDWENSVASSDQAESLVDEEMKDLDIWTSSKT